MFLKELLNGVETEEIIGDLGRVINKVEFDSRKVSQGDVYFAAKGTQVDGHKFIQGAIEKGCRAIICEETPKVTNEAVTYVRVANTRYALGLMANNYFGNPSVGLTLIGVTGTNGKTTTATLLYELFKQLGKKCGLLSTIHNIVGEEIIDSTHTTGDAIQIASLIRQMIDDGCTHCFMEVTSHAIHQHRITGLNFDGAIFTNLTRDHLDYHETMENYRDVKKSFFDMLPPTSFSIVNTDDSVGEYMASGTRSGTTFFGRSPASEYQFSIEPSHKLEPLIKIDGQKIESPMIGKFNAYNISSVYLAARAMGVPKVRLKEAIEVLKPPAGRMQTVYASDGRVAVVDYAHTPDALLNAIETLREVVSSSGKVITVVGCGGDRDIGKRPIMGKLAAEKSDIAIFTTDNPRREDPLEILHNMTQQHDKADSRKVKVIPDRKDAIQLAASICKKGDVVLVAGKGHEKFQLVSGEKLPFDDVAVVTTAFGSK